MVLQDINLNKEEYSQPGAGIRLLKRKVSSIPEELIFVKYLGSDFRVGGVCSSPFRKDTNPSFGVFRDADGTLVFNDLGEKDSGTSFDFLFKYYKEVLRLFTIKDMYARFNMDFKDVNDLKKSYDLNPSPNKIKKAIYKKKKDFKLEIRVREYLSQDIIFWKKFGISEDTLRMFNVFPISAYFINDKGFISDPLAYAYIETKDGKHTIKIYQPFNKKMKWIANVDFSIHQGYRLLPPKGDLLIITKSLKDVMSLWDTLNIHSIAVQGEKARMKASVREEYLNRFSNVLTLFDNDPEGINLYEYFKDIYGIEGIMIPGSYNSKDYSDLVKHIGEEDAKNVLSSILSKKLDKDGSFKKEKS